MKKGMQDKKSEKNNTTCRERRQDIEKEDKIQNKRRERKENKTIDIATIIKAGHDKKDKLRKKQGKIGNEVFKKIFCITVQFF